MTQVDEAIFLLTHNLCEEYHPNGVLKSTCYKTLSGKIEGVHRLYNTHGQIIERFFFKDGRKNGTFIFWRGDGSVMKWGRFKDGYITGPTANHNRDGSIVSGVFVNGLITEMKKWTP